MGKKFLPSRQNGIEVVLFSELLDEFFHRLFGFEALSLCDDPVAFVELLICDFLHILPPRPVLGNCALFFSIAA